MSSGLLQDKRTPPARAASAAAIALLVIGAVCYLLNRVHSKLESAHGSADAVAALKLTACYPLLTVVGLILVIPLGVYVTDHAPFQSLNLMRPDHYARLVLRVHKAWLGASDGKLQAKEL